MLCQGFKKLKAAVNRMYCNMGYARYFYSVVRCRVSFTKVTTRNGTRSEKNTVINLNNPGNSKVFGSKCKVFLNCELLGRMF